MQEYAKCARKTTYAVAVVSACLLCLICFTPAAHAHALMNTTGQSTESNHATTSSAATVPHVTIIVLDMSGSMATNDPNGLRCSAASAFIALSGPGDFIGVVGLDNKNGEKNGPFISSLVWAQPGEMATLAERQSLQQTITTDSNNCQPDNTTPTYDALQQALKMLLTASQNAQIDGSVILLTDGTPDPDTVAQINAINADLLPQFKQHHWPIDTIALGQDGPIDGLNGQTFHSFLSGVADATSGKFYDDGHGEVEGISPLNIAPFFVDIFALRIGRTVNKDIPPQQLNGATSRQNFVVSNYTDSLDIVVVKDQPDIDVSLTTPGGQPITQSGAGVIVSRDPHYVIFAIDQPQPGFWELVTSGSGQFLMDSLKVSSIKASIDSITLENSPGQPGSALPLGQPLSISASLSSNGQQITDTSFSMSGTITYAGGLGKYSQPFGLNDNKLPGTYVGNIIVPETAPAGTYDVEVKAYTISEATPVATQDQVVRIERFPEPLFLSSTGSLTQDQVDTTVVRWDQGLQLLYGQGWSWLQRLSQWPLNALPAQPLTSLTGQIQLQGQIYPDASTSASITRAGSKESIELVAFNQAKGHFRLSFLAPASGIYVVTFKTSGRFADSHGDFGTTVRTVEVTVRPASLWEEAWAWIRTGIYLIILFVLCRILVFLLTPRPFGEWELKDLESETLPHQPFRDGHRGFWQWFLHRSMLYSEQAGMPAGLQFRFHRGYSIEVRAHGPNAARWMKTSHDPAPRTYEELRQLLYKEQDADGNPEYQEYSILPLGREILAQQDLYSQPDIYP